MDAAATHAASLLDIPAAASRVCLFADKVNVWNAACFAHTLIVMR